MAESTAERDEKTEDATPRRRQESREQGQVALSAEIVTASMLWAGFGLLLVGGGLLARACGGLLAESLGNLGARGTEPWDVAIPAGLLGSSFRSVALAVVGIVGPMWCVALLAGYVQIGFQVAPKAIHIDVAKLDPFKNIGRLFGIRGAVRSGLGLLKIIVILGTMGVMVWRELPALARLTGNELGPTLAGVGQVALRATGAALAAIAGVALFDLLFQRWQHERDLKMTRREVRDEAKATEGDPHVKARIRQIQRELARRRMMEDVPKATVVVTNPTHYAVALRYERDAQGGERRAPVVVAKGVDFVAQRIKEVAREAGVTCYEDVALARALHAKCEIGDEIPEALYQAVAAVLAYVYRVQGAVQRA
jgi:flagellar biosynthesis protein FlhB